MPPSTRSRRSLNASCATTVKPLLSSFPPELLLHTFSTLPYATLFSLLHTSRYLRTLASSTLLSDTSHPRWYTPGTSPVSFAQFLDQLSWRQSLIFRTKNIYEHDNDDEGGCRCVECSRSRLDGGVEVHRVISHLCIATPWEDSRATLKEDSFLHSVVAEGGWEKLMKASLFDTPVKGSISLRIRYKFYCPEDGEDDNFPYELREGDTYLQPDGVEGYISVGGFLKQLGEKMEGVWRCEEKLTVEAIHLDIVTSSGGHGTSLLDVMLMTKLVGHREDSDESIPYDMQEYIPSEEEESEDEVDEEEARGEAPELETDEEVDGEYMQQRCEEEPGMMEYKEGRGRKLVDVGFWYWRSRWR